ncbi:MAG: cyclase family protein [Sphingomonadaceae bacterium]
MRLLLTSLCLGVSLATMPVAAEPLPPSPHGPDDRIGAMNHLSSEATRRAARLVRLGKVYQLGVVTDTKTPAYPGRTFQMLVSQGGDGTGTPVGAHQITANDDLLITWLGIGSQIDGFGHIGRAHVHYNGVHARDFVRPEGLLAFGTESIPPTATRGILLDMVKLLGSDPVPAGRAFNRKEIDAAAKAAGVTIGKGDVVLFHTGWLKMAQQDPAAFIATQPGLGREGADYLAGLGVAMVGADTAALEVIPFEKEDEPFAVHQILLTKHGVHILESMNTAELAEDGATEFLFTLGIPRFRGAVQMVVNPVVVR